MKKPLAVFRIWWSGSILVAFERRRFDLEGLLAQHNSPAIAAITAAELLIGVERADSPERRRRRESFVQNILARMPIIAFDLKHRALAIAWALPFLALAAPCVAAQTQTIAGSTRTAVSVWDTMTPSRGPPAPETLIARTGWNLIPPGQQGAMPFRGDAVIGNGRLFAVVRKEAPGVELYAQGEGGPIFRTRLLLTTPAREPSARLSRVAVIEHSSNAASLEASYQTAAGAEVAARFRLKRGDVWLETEAAAGAAGLRLDCPSRYVILPDFFADDIIVDPRKPAPDVAEVPGDNFLLHLVGAGDGMVLPIFDTQDRDQRLLFSGQSEKRIITGSEVDFGKGRRIWVALLQAPGLWHCFGVEAGDAGKVKHLEWKMSFAAAWRCDFTRDNGLTSSWEMLLWDKDAYRKPTIAGTRDERLDAGQRQRWITFLGKFSYPCWIDDRGQGHVQPIQHSELKFRGPALLYPLARCPETPLGAHTVVDVLRGTLGVGPCQYLLDLEGQKQEYKGAATCAVFDHLNGIYARNEQVKKRAEVDRALDDALTFVTHIRGRITRYVEFGKSLRTYLAEQKKLHPELTAFLDDMDKLAAEIDARFAARADDIKTPAHVAAMNEKFRKALLGYEGSDAFNKCQQYTRALVVIGDNQDELSSECRWVVKNLRQQAGLALAQDPRVAPIAREIRARAQKVLRHPAYHEADRH